jgi:hypothetical protein
MDFVLFEYQLHLVIASDLALVGWILELVGMDVRPYLLDALGARELLFLSICST